MGGGVKYLDYHWHILCDPDVVFGMDREIWNHLYWLVTQEKHAMLKWEDGEWVRR